MRSPALSLYLAASLLAGPIARPLLRRRLARGREDAARLDERLGEASLPRPEGPLVWLHGASVGEATSALPLVSALLARGLGVLVTTGTVTAAERMGDLLPEGALHQFVPVDTASAVRGFLDHWRPDLAILMESELWPRLITETGARAIPMALVNARLSERSFRRWRALPGMARQLFGSFDLVLTQDEVSVGRVGDLGGRARHAGNLKAMVEAPESGRDELQTIRELLGGRPLWLAASTHAGEEEAMIAAQRALAAAYGSTPGPGTDTAADAGSEGSAPVSRQSGEAALDASPHGASDIAPEALEGAAPQAASHGGTICMESTPPSSGAGQEGPRVGDSNAQSAMKPRPALTETKDGAKPLLILAPRHPERGEAVAGLLSEAGLSFARRSEGKMPGRATDVWLADTLGEMGLWYRLAPIAFIGGSLVEVGGHTPFEPIALGAAVLHGPHVANFAPVYAALDRAGGAIEISNAPELAATLRALLADPGLAEGLSARAHEVHAALLPDLDAMVEELVTLMEAP